MSQPTLIEEPTRSEPHPLGALGRWGQMMARHRRIVVAVWLLLVVLGGAAYPLLHDRLGAPDYAVPGSVSDQADQLVAQHFSQYGVEQDVIVVHSPTHTADAPEFRAAVDRALDAARATPGVVATLGPFQGDAARQISEDRHTALALLGLEGDIAARVATATELQSAVTALSGGDITLAVTGYGPIQADLMATETADMSRAEAIGLPVAAVVLVLALGAVAAATLPITVTAAGIAAAIGALFGLSTFLAFDTLTLSVAVMIATGTAIDYAMFIVSRFAEEMAALGVRNRADRAQIDRAVGLALDTTGRTVLASGLIIMISLSSLAVVGLTMLNGIAIGVITAVSGTLAAAVTLLPALLAMFGPAVHKGALPARLRPALTQSAAAASSWARWTRTVMGKPVLFGTLGVALLAAAALPLTGIKYGIDMGIGALAERPSGQATELVREEFGPGLLAPITVVATGPGDTALTAEAQPHVQAFTRELSDHPRVETVISLPSAGRWMLTVVPTESFDSPSVSQLVDDIRSRATEVEGAEILLGGTPAVFADVSDRITERFPLLIALVLAVSLAFLIVAFRSIVLAVKAIALNLLATGAALGITVAVFQNGIGESVLGFQSTGFVQVFLPMLVFAVLFGLSMDYEVFLIRRMKEAWDREPDNTAAVAEGMQRTARPITAAAAIMVAVFASFVTADVLELKQIGFALAVAITIDAVVVRMVLVPAFMRLFGRWNWWLPTLRTPAVSR
ncbi:MMPL family transporter [Nocardia puris]|uniref:MMPL family transporter n=1 Tax=Nocardia puris TaxID=208602 RepID=UPI001894F5AF|nr:MMPL family transporter [Nocardia puris]MBF6213326.1 MMPL family transporter [Nocardia puris]MBF6369506.1 MMPL family transporter [Nocardia puris]MBF6462205.1 MMPL family transporter [Nocardia puris]